MAEVMSKKQVEREIKRKEGVLDKQVDDICGLHKKLQELGKKIADYGKGIAETRAVLASLREQLVNAPETVETPTRWAKKSKDKEPVAAGADGGEAS